MDHCRDLLRRVFFAVDLGRVVGTHVPFDRAYGSRGVDDRLTFCNVSNKSFAFFGKSYDGRGCSESFCVCDNNRASAFHNSKAGVGSSKINSNNFV